MDSAQRLIFASSQFPPEAGEDEETNPGIYGKALAAWLCDQLARRGYVVKRTVAEDFGRLIQLEDPNYQLYVACASTDETAGEWRVFSFAEFGWLASVFGRRSKPCVVSKVMADVKAILQAAPSITDLREE